MAGVNSYGFSDHSLSLFIAPKDGKCLPPLGLCTETVKKSSSQTRLPTWWTVRHEPLHVTWSSDIQLWRDVIPWYFLYQTKGVLSQQAFIHYLMNTRLWYTQNACLWKWVITTTWNDVEINCAISFSVLCLGWWCIVTCTPWPRCDTG